MANLKKDENGRNTLTAASNSDGTTVVPIFSSPSTHFLYVNIWTTGSDADNNNGNAMLDENSVAVATALSSDGSGTIVELYADPITQRLLITN